MKHIYSLVLGIALLPACATRPPAAPLETFVPDLPPRMTPPAVGQTCRVSHYLAWTLYATKHNGEKVWTVVFDAATTADITSSPGNNELDCLLDEELRDTCPGWVHDQEVETVLGDGRMRATGFCNRSETTT
jgi:hypothetical protein